jgi:glycosyltransferase involved in cell wall biosynthesis
MRHVPSLSGERIRVIPNCVDTDYFSPGSVPTSIREQYGLSGKFVVLYFGKLKKTKGIEELCKAVAILKRKVDATLIIGGSIAASDSFANHLKETYEGVIFTGFVKDPRPYFEAADVFAIYTPGFHGGETFAIALAEAMSMGLPVVCSDNPIFHEVTHENAVFVPPQNPEALAEGLLSIARDPSRAASLGSGCRKIAEVNYNARSVASQLEETYREAVS